VETSLDDLVESAKFQLKVRDKLSETHKGINDLRQVRKQVSDYMNTVQDTAFKKDIEQVSKPMLDALQKIEDELIQHKAKAFQDLLALPIKLNDKMAGLSNVAASAESKLTQSVQDSYNDISKAIDGHLKTLKKILDEDVPKFNQAAEGKKAPAIKVK
jgi:transcriptional regulator with GAF, ATPase, and Fis domain